MGKIVRWLLPLVIFIQIAVLSAGCARIEKPADSSGTPKLLLRGDLHMHTKYSHDGQFTLEETANFCKQAGYDFAALTDHNVTQQNSDPYKDDKFIFIPGMELTLQRGVGHANILGIPDPIRNPSLTMKKEVAKYITDVKEQGAYVQINHPFDPQFPWGVGFDQDFDWIELWNSAWNDPDKKAMEWWQAELQKGRKIVGTGGSDAHTQTANRSPFDCVYCDSRDPKDILSAIKKGNLYVSFSSKGPDIELKSGGSIMGDTVRYGGGKTVELTISNAAAGEKIRVVSDKGTEFETKMTEATFNKKWNLEKRLFYRVEIYSGERLLAFSNPLYITQK